MTDRLVLGHSLDDTYPVPSGWRARCECGHTARGITRGHALENHDAHLEAASHERATRTPPDKEITP